MTDEPTRTDDATSRSTVALLVVAALLAGCVGLATVSAAATGSVATQTAATTIVDGENVSVELRPADTANGDRYASVDAADELRIDFESLNRDGWTTAHRVFTIDVESDEYLAATVDSDTADVSFYWESDPSATATENATIEPDGQVSVGVAVRSGDTVDDGTFTVSISETDAPDDDPADDPDDGTSGPSDDGENSTSALELSKSGIEFDPVHAGDDAVFDIEIRNTDSEAITETVGFEVDDARVAEQVVTVPGDSTRIVSFVYNFPEPGTYEISIDGEIAGTVIVEPPRLRVSNAQLSPSVVERGEPVTIVADVTNYGAFGDRFAAELSVGGAVVDRETVYVEPGATERVTFERSFDRRGGYEVAVSGEPAGRVQVESTLGASVRHHGTEHGPVLAVLSIPVLGLLALRWSRGGALRALLGLSSD